MKFCELTTKRGRWLGEQSNTYKRRKWRLSSKRWKAQRPKWIHSPSMTTQMKEISSRWSGRDGCSKKQSQRYGATPGRPRAIPLNRSGQTYYTLVYRLILSAAANLTVLIQNNNVTNSVLRSCHDEIAGAFIYPRSLMIRYARLLE